MIRKLITALALSLALALPAFAQPVPIVERGPALDLIEAQTRLMQSYAEAWEDVLREVVTFVNRADEACLERNVPQASTHIRLALATSHQGVVMPPAQLPLSLAEVELEISAALWADLVAEDRHVTAFHAVTQRLREAVHMLAEHERSLNQRLVRLIATGLCR